MQSVMNHSFSQVPSANINRSTFVRSHGHKTTFDAGYLIPFLVDEVLPGDTFKVKASAFARLATPVVPIMDNMYLDTFFFFVPNRLLWENWEKFMGERRNPTDSTDYLIPVLNQTTFASGSLGDYFGLPTDVALTDINVLPFRAYNLIYNEWFRDQNLQDSVKTPTEDGPDSVVGYDIMRRNKRHDYFTSCLPFPQKGDAVNLPLGQKAPIFTDAGHNQNLVIQNYLSDEVSLMITNSTYAKNHKLRGPATTTLFADLSDATSATINDLREAFQIQKLLERDARGGTRYVELIKSHFGVTSPDYRLQRPEYLGGGSSFVNVSPIAQTSSTDSTTPQGNLAAMGTVGVKNNGFTKSFTEHGFILGLCSVRADLTYQRCVNRMWSRQTRYDFYWPSLAHIGEQSVLNKEIYAQGTDADDDVFGYIPRYDEYRYKPSQITGLFRSDHPQSLDVWHLSQDFTSLPLLNDSFIQDNPPIDRAVAVTDEPHFIADFFLDMKCTRPMPTYAVPGMIDHF